MRNIKLRIFAVSFAAMLGVRAECSEPQPRVSPEPVLCERLGDCQVISLRGDYLVDNETIYAITHPQLQNREAGVYNVGEFYLWPLSDHSGQKDYSLPTEREPEIIVSTGTVRNLRMLSAESGRPAALNTAVEKGLYAFEIYFGHEVPNVVIIRIMTKIKTSNVPNFHGFGVRFSDDGVGRIFPGIRAQLQIRDLPQVGLKVTDSSSSPLDIYDGWVVCKQDMLYSVSWQSSTPKS